MRPSLLELANKYGTDKGDSEPNYHGYANTYDALFDHMRDKPIVLMEIGVSDRRFPGASLRMWHDYFTTAKIIGIDILDTSTLEAELERVETYQIDQSNRDVLEAFCSEYIWPEFDIMVDDGSHISQQQFISLAVLFQHLHPNGMYIIEDAVSAAHNGEAILQWAKKFANGEPIKPDVFLDDEWEYFIQHVESIEVLHDGDFILIRKAVK